MSETADSDIILPELVRPARALLSVSDKTGLVEFARFLHNQGIELLSTGGSAKTIESAGLPVIEVSKYTGVPEMMDGRVKTLHPKIHGGILALRGLSSHSLAMDVHEIGPIDLVIVNLYPFTRALASGAEPTECIENIDIGGPAMVRAAAKNYGYVCVVVEPDHYTEVMETMAANDGATTKKLRRRLAVSAFSHTAAYDTAIANWFAGSYMAASGQEAAEFSNKLLIAANLNGHLRYGENQHQAAAVYLGDNARAGVARAEQLQGKALSFNNISDTDAAYELVAEFMPYNGAACAIIKHGNPCGVSVADRQMDAYLNALSCDPISAFGGIIAFNAPLEKDTAEEIIKLFVEVIIAPDITDGACNVLKSKKNLRVLNAYALPDSADAGVMVKSIAGGYLAQSRDTGCVLKDDLRVVTKRAPIDEELRDMLFAFRVCKHVKSNAIVYAKDRRTIGIGAGQMSRVDSSRIAVWKAGKTVKNVTDTLVETALGCQNSVVASDAFFPFSDGLLAAADAGATAIIQPGGSVRDDEVIAAADERGLSMVFTGMRHFRH